MKSFNEFVQEIEPEEEPLDEARGVFNTEQYGKPLLSGSELYTIISTGIIDDWDSFKQQFRNFVKAVKTTIPKYFTKLESKTGKKLYLVGSRQGTSPAQFPGFSWPRPNMKKSISLKPLTFKGITEAWLTPQSLRSKLFKAIMDRNDLDPMFKEYLISLYDHYLKGTKIIGQESIAGYTGDILKDYGEIVGALWYLLKKHSKGEIFLPASGNYPLIDSLVRSDGKETQLSSKSGNAATNTIKGPDLIKILNKMDSKTQKSIRSKYKAEINMLDVIAKDTAVVGSIKAFNIMEPAIYRKYRREIDATIKLKSITKLVKSPVSNGLIDDLLKLTGPIKAKGNLYSKAGILYLMSKYIEAKSRHMNFGQFASVILSGYVVYVHANKLNSDGSIEFKYSNLSSGEKKASLRFKGTVTRASDKLGLQLL